MEKADRFALIRALYLNKAKGFAYHSTPTKPAKVKAIGQVHPFAWPKTGSGGTERIAAFLKQPEPKSRPTVRIKRGKKLSPLTKIAEQWRHLERVQTTLENT